MTREELMRTFAHAEKNCSHDAVASVLRHLVTMLEDRTFAEARIQAEKP
jgi:hypothetical protein